MAMGLESSAALPLGEDGALLCEAGGSASLERDCASQAADLVAYPGLGASPTMGVRSGRGSGFEAVVASPEPGEALSPEAVAAFPEAVEASPDAVAPAGMGGSTNIGVGRGGGVIATAATSPAAPNSGGGSGGPAGPSVVASARLHDAASPAGAVTAPLGPGASPAMGLGRWRGAGAAAGSLWPSPHEAGVLSSDAVSSPGLDGGSGAGAHAVLPSQSNVANTGRGSRRRKRPSAAMPTSWASPGLGVGSGGGARAVVPSPTSLPKRRRGNGGLPASQVPSPLARWNIGGRGQGCVQDVWTEESPGKIRACVIAKASDEFGLNLTQNPRELLKHPELVSVLFPGADAFLKPASLWETDISEFVRTLVSAGDSWGFSEALKYVGEHGHEGFTETGLQEMIDFVAQSVAIDPICVDGSLGTVFAFFTGLDHRIVDGCMRWVCGSGFGGGWRRWGLGGVGGVYRILPSG